MAKRYHFELRDGDVRLPDEVGVEAGDLDEAIREVGTVIDEMRQAGELTRIGGAWRIVIRDERDAVLSEIPLDR